VLAQLANPVAKINATGRTSIADITVRLTTIARFRENIAFRCGPFGRLKSDLGSSSVAVGPVRRTLFPRRQWGRKRDELIE
jgi:hypothetical protein